MAKKKTKAQPKPEKKLLDKPVFFHFRFMNIHSGKVVPQGGATVCCVPGTSKTKWGLALCSPLDAYNKKIGRKIASSRIAVPLEDKPRRDDEKEIEDLITATHLHGPVDFGGALARAHQMALTAFQAAIPNWIARVATRAMPRPRFKLGEVNMAISGRTKARA